MTSTLDRIRASLVGLRMPCALEALDAEHAALDPVRLLSQIRAAQQALVAIADAGPGETVVGTETPLDAFLSGLRLAWQEGEVRPTARPKVSKPRGRTVPDPLEGGTTELKAWFEAEPGITGRQLLDRLQAADPETYPDKLIRTVQRRLKVWRRERARALVIGPIAAAEANLKLGSMTDEATTTRLGNIPA